VLTGAVSFLVGFTISNIYGVRTQLIFDLLSRPSFLTRMELFTAFNVTVALTGCLITLFLAPAAAGSGIPEVKAHLNGVPTPSYFTWRAFVAKVLGSACSVSSGLAVGKEGPSVHIGSIIASMMGKHWLLKDTQRMDNDDALHLERDSRDFVACGAAAGLAAGFGTPLAGVFFGLEMATARWRAELTWRTLLTCAMSVWTIHLLHSFCSLFNVCFHYSEVGLLHTATDFQTPWRQFLPVAFIGILGGLAGALFTRLSIKIQKFRAAHRHGTILPALEVLIVCATFSMASFMLLQAGSCIPCSWVDPECTPGSPTAMQQLRIKCPPAHYNDMAVLLFNTQPTVIQSLLQSKFGLYSSSTLLIYAVLYFVNAVVSYGLVLPSGLFTPSILFGVISGRLYAHLLRWTGWFDVDPGLYALLGAAAFFGGGLRFTAAIAVLLLEMTESEDQLPFIIITLIIAKGVADRFTASIPDEFMKLKGFSFLSDTLPRFSRSLAVADVMSEPGIVLSHMETLKGIRKILAETSAQDFPVNYVDSGLSTWQPRQDTAPSSGGFSSVNTPPSNQHRGPLHRGCTSGRPRGAHQPSEAFQGHPRGSRSGGSGGHHPQRPSPTGGAQWLLGTVNRAVLEHLADPSQGSGELTVDLRGWVKPVMAVPVDTPMPTSYDMYLKAMSSTGAQQIPVVAAYGPALAVLDRSCLAYAPLKATYEAKLREGSGQLWSMGSMDMPLLIDQMSSAYHRQTQQPPPTQQQLALPAQSDR